MHVGRGDEGSGSEYAISSGERFGVGSSERDLVRFGVRCKNGLECAGSDQQIDGDSSEHRREFWGVPVRHRVERCGWEEKKSALRNLDKLFPKLSTSHGIVNRDLCIAGDN